VIENNYPVARLVAPRIQNYFVGHLERARASGETVMAPVPDEGIIEAVINAAFWASLRREEGYVPKISLAYLSPEHDTHPLLLEQPLPLTPSVLAKVAPIVERAGIHLGVWHRGDALYVWGTIHAVPAYCFVVEVVEPGLLVVKHRRSEKSGKYVNVAVLEGDHIMVVDDTASSLPDCPALLASLLGFDSPASWAGSVNVLVQLAVSMRAHGRGGLLLVVPSGTDEWRESIVHPIPYAVSPAFLGLSQLVRAGEHRPQAGLSQEVLSESVNAIAGLTAVDGATVLTTSYELLAFGAKITRRRGWPLVEQVTITEPIEGGVATVLTPTQLGGTRHLSAAQFVHDQRNAIALVASQDRRFTVFAWSPCAEGVHGHRVESLLI
jgi:hypothetical protein